MLFSLFSTHRRTLGELCVLSTLVASLAFIIYCSTCFLSSLFTANFRQSGNFPVMVWVFQHWRRNWHFLVRNSRGRDQQEGGLQAARNLAAFFVAAPQEGRAAEHAAQERSSHLHPHEPFAAGLLCPSLRGQAARQATEHGAQRRPRLLADQHQHELAQGDV